MSTLGHSPKAVWPVRPPRCLSIPVLSPQVSPARAAQQMGSENGSDSADSTPPPPPLKWIQYGSESQQEARQGTDTLHQYDGSLGKPREMSVFRSVYIWASYNGFARFSEKCYHKYLCNWIADCVLALSFLKVAHRVSAIHDRGLFFNDLLTCCSRLRSTYPVLLEIFFNLAAWRPLSSQGFQNKDTKCRISTSEEDALHHVLLRLVQQTIPRPESIAQEMGLLISWTSLL